MDIRNGYDGVNDELVGMPGAEIITSLSGKKIYALEREGKFPRRVKLGRRSAWVKRELHEWVQERIAARPAQPIYLPIIPSNARRKGRTGGRG